MQEVFCNAAYRKCQLKDVVKHKRQLQNFCNADHRQCQIENVFQYKRQI